MLKNVVYAMPLVSGLILALTGMIPSITARIISILQTCLTITVLVTNSWVMNRYVSGELKGITGLFITYDQLGIYFLLLLTCLYGIYGFFMIGHSVRRIRQVQTTVKQAALRFALFQFFYVLLFMTAVAGSLEAIWGLTTLSSFVGILLVLRSNRLVKMGAVWNYFVFYALISGISLIGILLFDYVSYPSIGAGLNLRFSSFPVHAADMNLQLLKVAFVFGWMGIAPLVGLFPLNGWLAGGSGKVPFWSVWLTGAQSVELLFLMRWIELLNRTPAHVFVHWILILFGFLTVLFVVPLLWFERNVHRIAAYVSFGMIGMFLGAIGTETGTAIAGALLLFMLVQITLSLVTAWMTIGSTRDHLKRDRTFLLLSGYAIIGMPPFGTFTAWFFMLRGSAMEGKWVYTWMFLAAGALLFIGISKAIVRMLSETYSKIAFADNRYDSHKNTLLKEALRIIPILGVAAAGWIQPGWFQVLLSSVSMLFIGKGGH